MDDKIIGIEVAGLTYGLKDEDTASEAEQAKRKAGAAEEAAEAASSAVEEQAEKIAEIESNIGDVNISELSAVVEGHTEELSEISEELPKIKTDISDIKFKGGTTPLFTLDRIEAKGVASTPTISIPASVSGTGVFKPQSSSGIGYNFSLHFFSDCIALTGLEVMRYGAVPAEWSSFGSVEFGILYSYIKTLLKNKYPDRAEEIDNYVDNILSTFSTTGIYTDKQSIVFQGEPGAECLTTQQATAGGSDRNYFSFRYYCNYVLKVLTQGTYYGSSVNYNTFFILRKKPV